MRRIAGAYAHRACAVRLNIHRRAEGHRARPIGRIRFFASLSQHGITASRLLRRATVSRSASTIRAATIARCRRLFPGDAIRFDVQTSEVATVRSQQAKQKEKP
jgi:hypothetical protein